MMFFISFAFVGCEKNAEDMGDGEDTEQEGGAYGDPDGMVAPLYGTKLLYRPNDYNYNTGSGGTEGNENNYYGQYAWRVINDLYLTYGISQTEKIKDNIDGNATSVNPYFYDSIRYQVDTVGTVTGVKDSAGVVTEIETDLQYQIIGADYLKAWNWSFKADTVDTQTIFAAFEGIEIAPGNPFQVTIGNNHYLKLSETDFATEVKGQMDFIMSNYQSIYLGTSTQQETPLDQYSSYVKLLEYAMYNFALDVNPQRISIDHSQPNDATGEPFTVLVGNPAKPLSEALSLAKATFESHGTYVGLSQRQLDKLGDWILTNVIGVQADDGFKTYTDVYEVLDEEGNFSHYEFASTPSTKKLGRNYETAVDNILNNNFKFVTIGNEAGGDPTINEAFLSSEVVEYCGEGFFVDGDEWFVTDEFMQTNPLANKLPYIPAREYQSAVFMPMSNWELRGIYVALKYDADGLGTADQWGEESHGYALGGRWNADLYIDIVVELNYYSAADNKTYSLGSKKCRVYDGPFDPFFSNSFVSEDQYDEWGNVCFDNFKDIVGESHMRGENFVVGAYNHEALKSISTFTDVGDYLKNYRSIAPIKLVGTSSQRNFYQLIEPTDDELSEYGTDVTYSTGQLNSSKVAGACDYLEVTYKVLKDKNDLNKNYKFHTAISGIY